jgi:hypothetical protein
MITVVAAFPKSNESLAKEIFGAGNEEFIFRNMEDFSKFANERLWELEKISANDMKKAVVEKFMSIGWLLGVVQYADSKAFDLGKAKCNSGNYRIEIIELF